MTSIIINTGFTLEDIINYSVDCLKILRENEERFKDGTHGDFHYNSIKKTLTKTFEKVNEPIYEIINNVEMATAET